MHVLITAGPTREYLDDVRYLSNASSGRMGYAIAAAALQRGWLVTLVCGPVSIPAPAGVKVLQVTSAQEMFAACLAEFRDVDGLIAVAAVADYRPAQRRRGKISRQPQPLHIELIPNPDILSELCKRKDRQWAVGFAVESEDLYERAWAKLLAKNCDAIVANAPEAMEASRTEILLIDRSGQVPLRFQGTKEAAASHIVRWIEENLQPPPRSPQRT